MPSTRTISIREFRETLTQLLREAQKNNVHFVVMRHAVPIAHVSPFSEKEMSLENLAATVAQARKDAAEGHTYTTEEVLAMIDRHAHRVHSSGRKGSGKSSSPHRTQNRTKDAVVRSPRKSPVLRKKTY
jgi:antitoxin (DNA-binding transcriptional repressor) of toxin-antitoxin stability system